MLTYAPSLYTNCLSHYLGVQWVAVIKNSETMKIEDRARWRVHDESLIRQDSDQAIVDRVFSLDEPLCRELIKKILHNVEYRLFLKSPQGIP